ncbi:MAG: ureidoglycolate lyase [Paracoccaceae bacterium]|nr:ureidoglycolate lyase [Paracoccaceae bacterium]
MSRKITIRPLTAEAFAPYGDVIDCAGAPDKIINAGLCGRFHDRAQIDVGTDGRVGINLFKSQLRELPYALELIERHPDGSQAFFPMCENPFLVIVADADLTPHAFITQKGQGINFHRGTWHGVLTPLTGSGQFVVIDRIGDTLNLEEHIFSTPYTVDYQH